MDFFTFANGHECRVCSDFSAYGRAFPQRCYKTCQGGSDAANAPAQPETRPSLPFLEICARGVQSACRPVQLGDTVIYGYPKSDGVTFDETQQFSSAEVKDDPT